MKRSPRFPTYTEREAEQVRGLGPRGLSAQGPQGLPSPTQALEELRPPLPAFLAPRPSPARTPSRPLVSTSTQDHPASPPQGLGGLPTQGLPPALGPHGQAKAREQQTEEPCRALSTTWLPHESSLPTHVPTALGWGALQSRASYTPMWPHPSLAPAPGPQVQLGPGHQGWAQEPSAEELCWGSRVGRGAGGHVGRQVHG